MNRPFPTRFTLDWWTSFSIISILMHYDWRWGNESWNRYIFKCVRVCLIAKVKMRAVSGWFDSHFPFPNFHHFIAVVWRENTIVDEIIIANIRSLGYPGMTIYGRHKRGYNRPVEGASNTHRSAVAILLVSFGFWLETNRNALFSCYPRTKGWCLSRFAVVRCSGSLNTKSQWIRADRQRAVTYICKQFRMKSRPFWQIWISSGIGGVTFQSGWSRWWGRDVSR